MDLCLFALFFNYNVRAICPFYLYSLDKHTHTRTHSELVNLRNMQQYTLLNILQRVTEVFEVKIHKKHDVYGRHIEWKFFFRVLHKYRVYLIVHVLEIVIGPQPAENCEMSIWNLESNIQIFYDFFESSRLFKT